MFGNRVRTGGGASALRRTYPNPFDGCVTRTAPRARLPGGRNLQADGTANHSVAEQSRPVYQGDQWSGDGCSIVHVDLTLKRCMMDSCRHQSLLPPKAKSSVFHCINCLSAPVSTFLQHSIYTGNFRPPKPRVVGSIPASRTTSRSSPCLTRAFSLGRWAPWALCRPVVVLTGRCPLCQAPPPAGRLAARPVASRNTG